VGALAVAVSGALEGPPPPQVAVEVAFSPPAQTVAHTLVVAFSPPPAHTLAHTLVVAFRAPPPPQAIAHAHAYAFTVSFVPRAPPHQEGVAIADALAHALAPHVSICATRWPEPLTPAPLAVAVAFPVAFSVSASPHAQVTIAVAPPWPQVARKFSG